MSNSHNVMGICDPSNLLSKIVCSARPCQGRF